MKLVTPDMIPKIDRFAIEVLGIAERELMRRSGEAVLSAAENILPSGGRVLVLAGGGNNGGDGYAFGCLSIGKFDTVIYDVLSKGQRSESGKYYLNEFLARGGSVIEGLPSSEELSRANLIVDALFGTGFKGELSSELIDLSESINAMSVPVLAVDVPLGIDAEYGRAGKGALRADTTVQLSFIKVGLLSYPAREFVGNLVYSDLSLPKESIFSSFTFDEFFVDEEEAVRLLPKRNNNSNKGSFGKALLITGSEKYEGAGRLSLEAALRGGAGIVTYLSSRALRDRLISDFPEAIYAPLLDGLPESTEDILSLAKAHSSALVGSGSGVSEELYLLIKELLESDGAPIVLDADALNSVSSFGSLDVFRNSRRKLILTPHPMELSRLTGVPVSAINSDRLRIAKSFALENQCILLLKGAATIVTDGKITYVNSTGSSALAKGGSGDALAGLIVSLLAFSDDPLGSTALAAYIHGKAGDNLAKIYSDFGVTPSDLPKEMAKAMASLSADYSKE